jgi:hypothetical protein
MQFGSKIKRNIFIGSIINLVPDALIAIIAAWATDSAALGFFAVLIGLQILYFLIWAKTALWQSLLFWFRGRKQLTEHLLDYLRTNQYPEPDEYENSAENYFQRHLQSKQGSEECTPRHPAFLLAKCGAEDLGVEAGVKDVHAVASALSSAFLAS